MNTYFSTEHMSQLDIARAYTRCGITVIPYDPVEKKPLCKLDKVKKASIGTELTRVEAFWRRYPNALIGTQNNKNCFVIDFDIHKADENTKPEFDKFLDLSNELKIDLQSGIEVTTKSGGKHFYYKCDDDSRRRLRPFPLVDILGEGGNVILPDQKSYVMKSTEAPWDAIANNTNFIPVGQVNFLINEWHDLVGAKKKVRGDSLSVLNSDVDYLSERTDGRSEFVVEFDSNGFIKTKGLLNTDKINSITHNKAVQTRIAKHIGLNLPRDENSTSKQRSIFYTHKDEHASMGVRWSKDRTHLIIRDFANHYQSKKDVVDYNLVHLYATQQYRRDIGKMKKPEYVTWLIRMLLDAKLIKPIRKTKLISDEFMNSEFMNENAKKMAEGLNLLSQVKTLYESGDNSLIITKSFAMGWCRFAHESQSTDGLKTLSKMGAITLLGWYNFATSKTYKSKAMMPTVGPSTRAISLTPLTTEQAKIIRAQSIKLTPTRKAVPESKPRTLQPRHIAPTKPKTHTPTIDTSEDQVVYDVSDQVVYDVSDQAVDDWIAVMIENRNSFIKQAKNKPDKREIRKAENKEREKKRIEEERRTFFRNHAMAKKQGTSIIFKKAKYVENNYNVQ